MAELAITHTHQDGTLIDGTSRGDGTAEILKGLGWRWGRSIQTWYVTRSRDQMAKTPLITATAAALEKAGHTVTIEIDDAPRATATVEADKAEHSAARAAALAQKAERREAAALAAAGHSRAAHEALPPMGEPIKVGHHSEARHRRAVDRAWNAWSKEVAAGRAADEAKRRAREAAAATGARNTPVTVANRIEKLAADARALERLHGTDSDHPQLQQLRDQLTYWQNVRTEQIAAGIATDYGLDTVRSGDLIKIDSDWLIVQRANRKTVRVQPNRLYPLGGTIPWYKVRDHRPAPQKKA
jgi:hypothetical protein